MNAKCPFSLLFKGGLPLFLNPHVSPLTLLLGLQTKNCQKVININSCTGSQKHLELEPFLDKVFLSNPGYCTFKTTSLLWICKLYSHIGLVVTLLNNSAQNTDPSIFQVLHCSILEAKQNLKTRRNDFERLFLSFARAVCVCVLS